MKSHAGITLSVAAAVALSVCGAPSVARDLQAGDKVQALANLHPDMQRHVLFTLNYQLPALIPVCSDLTITKVGRKKLSFEYQGQPFELGYEGFTKDAGVSFQSAAQTLLGPACNRQGLESLSAVDRDGVRVGVPKVGMTRQGILFAMGRPPVHANPSLDVASWTYWRNRYVRMVITFDSRGVVTGIQ